MSAVPDDVTQRITRLYAGFNARDIESVLAELSDDVVWANGMEGGHVTGRQQVRAYWTRQFEQVSSTVEPERIETAPDGSIKVQVHQVVRPANSDEIISDTTVRHRFTVTNGLISRFDIG